MEGAHYLLTIILAQAMGISAAGEFKRMPDTRGQSFGLENFLLQPLNMVSQGDQRRRDHGHTPVPYEFQVQNEQFDMMKVIPTLPGASLLFDQQTLQDEIRPVHEYADMQPPPPPRDRQVTGEEPIRRRFPPQSDVRRPLEKPSEFHLSNEENDTVEAIEVPRPDRQRKRVMKRRRKKPTTPQPETVEDTLLDEIESILGQQSDVPVNYQEPLPNDGEEIRPGRIILGQHNKQQIPQQGFQNIREEEEERLQTQASQRTPESEPTRVKDKRPGFLLNGEEKQEQGHENFQDFLPQPPNAPTRYGIGDQFPNSQEQLRYEGGFLPSRNINHRKLQRPKTHQPMAVVPSTIQHEPEENLPTLKGEHKRKQNSHQSAANEDNIEEEDNYPPQFQVKNNINKYEKPGNQFEENYPQVRPQSTESSVQSTERLKTLLKQTNGQLSLSELLQTQNLSLADFLKGNPGALSALGGTKVNSEKNSAPVNSNVQVPKDHTIPHIPKISSKSRPFSKPSNNTKPTRRLPSKNTTTSTTETPKDLPKKLQIIEVTSDKPTYNGFAPKNPRVRGNHKPDQRLHKEKIQDIIGLKNEVDTVKESAISENETRPENNTEETLIKKDSEKSHRLPVYRLTTSTIPPSDYTIGEQRVVPKRYGDYKPKIRLDRRKPSSDLSTEGTTISDSQESTTKSTKDEVKVKPSKDPRNRVRIPFMSTNNPDISVIIPSKKNTTEKPKERTRERFHLYKRPNSSEERNENILETETDIATHSTTTAATSTTTIQYRRKETTTTEPVFDESSDEIIELLKMGNNAERLQKILESRNMTVEELLEKRANISKQPNVTHLFLNDRAPELSENEKVSELNDNYFHPSTEKNVFKHARIDSDHRQEREKMKSHLTNTFDELYVDESIVRPIKIPYDEEEKREAKSYEKPPKEEPKVSQKPVQRLNLAPGVVGKPKNPIPLWNVDQQTIYSPNPYGYPSYDLNRNLAGQTTELPKTPESDIISLETIKRNQDLNSRLRDNINNILKEQQEVVKEVKDDVTFIPPAVKSAIIASGVVMGIAVIVFVAIFAACGWKQRQFRLRARSSILNDSLNGSTHKKRSGTLSPVSFKRSALYKKSIDFEDTDSSVSGSSNTSSYLWNTLKHTFQSRNSTLKNRQEKEEKIQEKEYRSRRNTLSRDDMRDSFVNRDLDFPRRNTLGHDEVRRDSIMSRDTLSRDLTRDFTRESMSRDFPRESIPRDSGRQDSRRNSCYRDDTRRISTLIRESERCSFKKIDPDRHIIQTSVNFKRGGYNSSSGRHFDNNCDHFN